MNIIVTPYWVLGSGIAVCPFWEDSENGCLVVVSSNPSGSANKYVIAYVLAHEVGHVLGMMHTDADDHPMSGPVLGWDFDDRGFAVPVM